MPAILPERPAGSKAARRIGRPAPIKFCSEYFRRHFPDHWPEPTGLAKQMRAADRRGEELGLSEDEMDFYDTLEVNDSAVKVMGDETLRGIARELVASVRANVTIDWMVRENVRAQLRVLVKRILRKHGYPPDKQEKATQTVLEQAAVLSAEWATV